MYLFFILLLHLQEYRNRRLLILLCMQSALLCTANFKSCPILFSSEHALSMWLFCWTCLMALKQIKQLPLSRFALLASSPLSCVPSCDVLCLRTQNSGAGEFHSGFINIFSFFLLMCSVPGFYVHLSALLVDTQC